MRFPLVKDEVIYRDAQGVEHRGKITKVLALAEEHSSLVIKLEEGGEVVSGFSKDGPDGWSWPVAARESKHTIQLSDAAGAKT